VDEQKWRSSTSGIALLEYAIDRHYSARKWQLLAVAVGSRLDWEEIPLAPGGLAVVERYADGNARDKELDEALRSVSGIPAELAMVHWAASYTALAHPNHWPRGLLQCLRHAVPVVGVNPFVHLVRCIFHNPFRPAALTWDSKRQLVMRFDGRQETAGPWRKRGRERTLHIEDTYTPLTATDSERCRAIAARMYDTKDFSEMPILGDALEEAGITAPDVLIHCRMPRRGYPTRPIAPGGWVIDESIPHGNHYRGCHVVDAILGKE